MRARSWTNVGPGGAIKIVQVAMELESNIDVPGSACRN